MRVRDTNQTLFVDKKDKRYQNYLFLYAAKQDKGSLLNNVDGHIFPLDLILEILLYKSLLDRFDYNCIKMNQSLPQLELLQPEFSLYEKITKNKTRQTETDCYLELGGLCLNILHMIFSNNAEALQLFKQLDDHEASLLKKLDHNEILICSRYPTFIPPNEKNPEGKSYIGIELSSSDKQTLFHHHINFFVKTKDNPMLSIKPKWYRKEILFSEEELRHRSFEEIAIFADVIHPILEYIDEFISELKNGLQVDCLKNLKINISEGLRAKTPLQNIINTWLDSVLPEAQEKTVRDIIYGVENNLHNEAAAFISALHDKFSDICERVLEENECPERIKAEYYEGFRF